MRVTIKRRYLQQYLTFYYQYLPRIEAEKTRIRSVEEEEEEIKIGLDA